MGATDSAPSLKAAVLTGSVRTIEQRAARKRLSELLARDEKNGGARLARWQKNA